ncbi:MAG: hypothetical protein LBJ14_09015 [Desulfarculales bacterium]|jgi:hypothetical protein|nr:hypothetical protein [Desulfarculales bacterium]
MTFFKFWLIFLLVPVLFPVLPGLGRAAPLPPPADANAAVTRPVLQPAPPHASEGEIMENIEAYLRATVPDPDTYEPIDFSRLALFEEEESKAYKWGMRHVYRVGHPIYRVLFVDRIFFIAYDGRVESIIEYTKQPCIDCKW